MKLTPLIDLPKPGEQMVRFELHRSENLRIFGDMYSGKRLFLHLDWPEPKMTKAAYKEIAGAVATILNSAKQIGMPFVYCLVPEHLVKFESLFGFRVINYFMTDETLGENSVLMYQEV